jgi:3-hydroxyacyl-[acyl-carrier-protein] dehydratase
MFYNNEQVKKFLPHRDPFLFIDTVEKVHVPNFVKNLGEYDAKEITGGEIIAHYKTRAEHPIFKGHFPDYPIFPGVCQVEMMAQGTSFMACLLEKDPLNKKMDVALLGVDGARFRKPIFPDMDLVIQGVVLKLRGSILTSECKIFHKDQLMSEVTVMATLKLS